MKNVCFFNSIKFWGGGEKLHFEYAYEFKKKNYNVFLVTKYQSPLYEKAIFEGIPTFSINAGNTSFLNIFKIIKLVRFYKKEIIDTVIFSTSQDVKLGSISAKIAGVKNIVYLRGLATPIKASFVNRIIFKSILTHIVANSNETKRNILKHLGKYINAEKVQTIYHGIEVDHEDKSVEKLKEIREKGHGVILGNAGRLTAQKGQLNLIEVAKRLKEQQVDFTLFIAGTGEMQQELEQMIEEFNLQNDVVLLGFVKDMDTFMGSVDVFLLTSIWEGFGYVIVEAMIKSKPVVAFNISSNPEIVTANETGFLVEYPDLDGFAEMTKQLIADTELRKKMGAAGKQSVFDRFNISDRITEFEQSILS